LAAFWGGVEPRLIVASFAVLAASLWMYLFYGLLQGMQRFGWLAWLPQAWGVSRLILGAGFTILLSPTAFAAIVAQGVGVFVVLALCLWAVRGLGLPPGRSAARPAGTYRYLGASLVCLAGYGMLMNLDTTLARHFFDGETAGTFAKAATIARIAVFLPVPIAMALFPKVTSAGELTDSSWRLLLRALAFGGLIIASAVGVCLLFPQLPWSILYGRWSAQDADLAAACTRGMVLAMSPLALAYLLLNFEMAQRRFRWALALVPCGLAYVGGVAVFHGHPLHLAAVLGACNASAAAVLVGAVVARRRAI
jgi:O-antigen/teichoic acid export membrane protein